MDRGFRTGHERYKYFQPSRWAKWPFADVDVEEDHGAQVSEPPGGMAPTSLVHATPASIEVEWPAYVPREDVDGDAADGYHLDVASLCPIAGPAEADWSSGAEWHRAYKGNKRTYNIRNVSLVRDVLVRVRAYNSKGGGEWSLIRRYRCAQAPVAKLTEHLEMPFEWRAVDLEDVYKEEKLPEGSEERLAMMGKLHRVLHTHRTTLKVAFRYYSLVGGSASKDDEGDCMSMSQFLGFGKGARLFDEGGVTTSDCDRIYLRSVRDMDAKGLAAAVASAPAAAPASAPAPDGTPGKASSKEWEKARGAVKAVSAMKSKGNTMYQHHFIGGVIRLGNVLYASKYPDVPARVDHLMTEYLHPHVRVELDLLHDAFAKLMLRQPLLAVHARRRAECERVFAFYAQADKTIHAAKAMTTMNMPEMAYLMEDANLYDSKFGVRLLVDAFVRVNIEDDVYIQDDKKNTSTELVYEEFFEVLARMYFTREGGPRNKKPPVKKLLETGEDGLELARGFDQWLEVRFLPAAAAAIKKRKKEKGG